ncbi:hypothetical protein HHX47_DHR5000080 [Lentinula edodes]|nr:hypothetical protein HHX47_DHR5000080 [Lentinula edodes]
MASIAQIFSVLSASVECTALSLSDLDRFIRFTRRLKPEIALGMQHSSAPPPFLPPHVTSFLSNALDIHGAVVLKLWASLRQYIWELEEPSIETTERLLFDEHGSRTTKNHQRLESCETRYYPNYSVKIKAKVRRYYDEAVPSILHLEEHSFIQSGLSELFTACTLFAWVSSQNCALIYNHALSPYGQKHVSESKFMLTPTQVWRAFVLVSLLKDWRERGCILSVRDDGELNAQLKELMCERNDRMIAEGQSERLHACETCEKTIVITGVKHIWSNNMSASSQTAIALPVLVIEHYEEYRNLKGKGFFLLRKRLQRVGVQQPSTSLGLDSVVEENLAELLDIDGDDPIDPVHKSDNGNRPSKAMFARRRTHNEQLVVCSCGIISARATMFGAEAISGVKDFLKSVYPNPNDLPDVIFYDNNCQLQAHLLAQNDEYFRGTMLPVDVFHFKSKHKQSDEFCQKHCNPSQWTELVGEDGEWVFNSSAAEQANVWIGGYQAIVREMLYYNYNFFLDEMIKRRNAVLVAKLSRTNQAPYHIPSYPHVM